jgi:precorrin-2/cobalt-factor-2 C20-methyltransferase
LVEGLESLVLVPMADGDTFRLAAALEGTGPLVVYKGGRHLPAIARAIHDAGRKAVLGVDIGRSTSVIRALGLPESSERYMATIVVLARARAGDGH